MSSGPIVLLAAFTSAFVPLPATPTLSRSAFQRAPAIMIGGLGDSLKKAQDMMKNISPEKIKKAQEMTMKMQELQKELAATEIECKSADGKITVIYTGQSVPLSVTIDAGAMSQSAPELSDALTNALKQAFINSRKHADGRMMALYEEAGLGDLIRTRFLWAGCSGALSGHAGALWHSLQLTLRTCPPCRCAPALPC